MVSGVLLLLIQLAGGGAIAGTVLDATGLPVAGARVSVQQTSLSVFTAPDGSFSIVPPTLPASLVISAPGLAERTIRVTTASPLRIILQPRAIAESLTVTAGTAAARLSSPAAVTVLDAAALAAAPALTLDEQLRGIPGFSLFRRTSSRVANPTTQGVTLRGLAASGASRAAVVADDISLVDPFGGWVYWDRIPAAAIDRVEVARGGASDVYGSDAMGGAIRIDTATTGARLIFDGGQLATARASLFGGTKLDRFTLRGSAEQFTTGGYVMVEPASRGAVDVEAWSRHSSAFASLGSDGVEVRGSYFSERRGNGTPVQRNGTVARDVSIRGRGAVAHGLWTARGAIEGRGYDQAFSAIARDRSVERLTVAQRVATTTATAAADWLRGWADTTLFVAASARDVRAEMIEQGYPSSFSAAPFIQDPRQRSAALMTQISWRATPRVTLAGGARGELWATELQSVKERHLVGAFVPRASVAFRANSSTILRLSFQDAYRFPTINELYRGFQVGSVYTMANRRLNPEELLAVDGSVLFTGGRLTSRATVFVSRVTDAIVNVTSREEPGLIERVRDNAGSIRARGVELESEWWAWTAGALTASVVFTGARFASGELEALRVPQVPRLQASLGARGGWRRITAAFHWRYSGNQFDDDRNRFLLRAAAVTDARIGWKLRHGVEIFGAVENLFDEDQDVGRTPLRTVGLPRMARIGVRIWRNR